MHPRISGSAVSIDTAFSAAVVFPEESTNAGWPDQSKATTSICRLTTRASLVMIAHPLAPTSAIHAGSSVSELKWSLWTSMRSPAERRDAARSYAPRHRSRKKVVELCCCVELLFDSDCFLDIERLAIIVLSEVFNGFASQETLDERGCWYPRGRQYWPSERDCWVTELLPAEAGRFEENRGYGLKSCAHDLVMRKLSPPSSGSVPCCWRIYSWITSSVTLPLDATK